MPRLRKKNTSRGQVPAERYTRACNEVSLGSSVRQAALANNINHVTLSRFLKRRAEEGEVARAPGYNPHNRVFTSEQEGQVREYLKRAAAIYYGLTPMEVSVGEKGYVGLHRHTCYAYTFKNE